MGSGSCCPHPAQPIPSSRTPTSLPALPQQPRCVSGVTRDTARHVEGFIGAVLCGRLSLAGSRSRQTHRHYSGSRCRCTDRSAAASGALGRCSVSPCSPPPPASLPPPATRLTHPGQGGPSRWGFRHRGAVLQPPPEWGPPLGSPVPPAAPGCSGVSGGRLNRRPAEKAVEGWVHSPVPLILP